MYTVKDHQERYNKTILLLCGGVKGTRSRKDNFFLGKKQRVSCLVYVMQIYLLCIKSYWGMLH